MAIGFTDLTSTQRIPDKGLTRQTKPKVLKVSFGDGYEQRISAGINNLNQTFNVGFSNREKEEIDDIVAFLDSKNGISSFNFTIPDSNAGGNETTIKVVCETYSTAYSADNFYSCSATFRRVYEA